MTDTDALTEALAASRELNAAMAFGVPEEAWDDCRRGIAAALVPVVAQHVEDARRDALLAAADDYHPPLATPGDTARFGHVQAWLRDRAEAAGDQHHQGGDE